MSPNIKKGQDRAGSRDNVSRFCGFPLSEMKIDGLRIQIERQSERTQKVVFYDKKGVKWEIRTIESNENGYPTWISLYHRSKTGPMHYQRRSRKAGYESVKKLLEYIASHEEYEAQKRRHL